MNQSRLRPLSTLALTLALVAGCQRGPVEPPNATPEPIAVAPSTPLPAAHPAIPTGTPPAAPAAVVAPVAPAAEGTLQWDDPPGWVRTPPSSPMRRAQLRLPRAPGDSTDADLVVITFGAGQGGTTEANLARWYGQLEQPDGRPTASLATREQLTVGSLAVTLTEVTGRTGAQAMPGAPAAAPVAQARLLAAIVETPAGPWFFKILGPEQTVTAAGAAFRTMLRSMRWQAGAAATH